VGGFGIRKIDFDADLAVFSRLCQFIEKRRETVSENLITSTDWSGARNCLLLVACLRAEYVARDDDGIVEYVVSRRNKKRIFF
jgi:hypothetical protein